MTLFHLEKALWSGFYKYASKKLHESLISTNRLDRCYAAWALLKWHVSNDNFEEAENLLNILLEEKVSDFIPFSEFTAIAVHIWIHKDKIKLAHDWLNNSPKFYKGGAEWLLQASNSMLPYPNLNQSFSDAIRLKWINELFKLAGLSPVSRNDYSQPLSIDNLKGDICQCDINKQPLVSIIMPVYNGSRYITTALHSLLNQTWKNLEILVINDASTDDTQSIVMDLVKQDRRIKLLSLSKQSGAYVARNFGLKNARGEFVTNHDSDDWSHPKRIELMMVPLLKNKNIVATIANWVRCYDNMYFWRCKIDTGLINPTVSSLMVRKEILEKLGGWHESIAAADTELMERIRKACGDKSIKRIIEGYPLVFGRIREDALTSMRETHRRTEIFGARRLYLQLTRTWHAKFADGTFVKHNEFTNRALIPLCWDRNKETYKFDWVIVSNLSKKSKLFHTLLFIIQRGIKEEKKIALYHCPGFDDLLPEDQRILDMAVEGKITLLCAQDACDTEYVFYAGISENTCLIDEFPKINAKEKIYISNAKDIFKIFLLKKLKEDNLIESCEGERKFTPGLPTLLVCAHSAGIELFGAERSFIDMLSALSRLRVNLVAVLPSFENIYYINEIKKYCSSVVRIPLDFNKKNNEFFIQKYMEVIKKYDIKIVIVNTITLREPVLAAMQYQIPVFVYIHEILENDPWLCNDLKISIKETKKWLEKNVSGIFANSKLTAERWYIDKKTFIIGNAIDLERFLFPNHIDPRCIKAGLISSNIPKKGLVDLLEIAHHLKINNESNIKLCIIGPFNKYAHAVQKEASRKSLNDYLLWFPYEPKPETAISKVNIILNLSHVEESFGRTILEGMAAGRPIIAYNWGAIPELVEDGENGFLVEYRNTQEVANKLIYLGKRVALITIMGTNGRLKARQYTIEILKERLAKAMGLD